LTTLSGFTISASIPQTRASSESKRKGGHNITDEDVERRFEKRFEDLVKILPFCSEVRFYDNENGFVDVAEYKNGSLIIKGGYIPEWIIELKEYMAMGETDDEAITPVILLRY